jgi:GT2 family glycosyltransferase
MLTPILVIGFNRPKVFEKLLSKLDLTSGRRIYISIDGPRNSAESIKVKKVQKLAEKFVQANKHLKVQLRFSDSNLGCKAGVSSAIDWAFEKENALIILEDDIIVSGEFFKFMDFSLRTHESDSQIWHISGFSPLLPPYVNVTSYQTSFAHVWGWGTWKNRWVNYDRELSRFDPTSLIHTKTLRQAPLSDKANEFFRRNLVACKEGFDTWDFQWQFTIWFNGGLAISPGERLSGNLGFGPTASHTKFAGFSGLNLPPRKSISSCYLDREIAKRSEHLERLHEAIVFGIESSDTEIKFTYFTRISILYRSLPRLVELRARKVLAR